MLHCKISEINHDSNDLKLLAFTIANCRRFTNMTVNHEIDDAPSLSTDKLEQEIGKIIPRRNTPFARAVQIAPMPDYVEHREWVSQVGSLSAEAVVREYEAAAKEMEAMGADLIRAAQKCEAMTADVHKAIAVMQETATAYREDAKKMFARIEECALLSEQVRKTCEEMRQRIAGEPALQE
jgi:hypothetical protein